MTKALTPPVAARGLRGLCFSVCGAVAFFGAVSCGGSASETPPPLEPDPHAPPPAYEAPKAQEKPLTDEEPLPATIAPPTWGSGRKKAPLIALPDGG